MKTFWCLTEKVSGNSGQVEVVKSVKLLNSPPKSRSVEKFSFLRSLVGPALQTAVFSQEHCFTPRHTAKGEQKTSRRSSSMNILQSEKLGKVKECV